MPVIAVGVAIGASVVAGSAVAATVGGIAAISAVTALEVVAAVGATISAVGAVTRDKGLATAGMVIGAVGAIGGFAAGAGLLGEAAAGSAPLFGAAPAASTADAAGGAAAGAAAADQASAGTIDAFSGAASPDLPTPPVPPDAVPAGTGLAAGDQADLAKQVALGQSGGTNAIGAVTTEPALDPLAGKAAGGGFMNATPPAAQPDLIPPPAAPPNNLGAVDPTTGSTIASAVDPVTGKVVSLPDSPGMFDGILAFANKSPVVALGALQAGGSLLSGATSSLTPAQVSAYQAQAAANDAAAALSRQQTANLAMPKSVASSSPVTGAPGPLVPQGFINQTARVTPVTGAPA